MNTVTIINTNIKCSRFIFGTASLFNAGTARERYRLLKSAVENGFTHFDCAPYYGFGVAERDLAPILKEHPDVTFTTKVGIYSPGGEEQFPAAVFARKACGRFIRRMSRPTKTFDLARARASLAGSLRRTGRDAIDIYTLHDAEIELLNTQEWQRWLEDCVLEGKIRYFGVATYAHHAAEFLKNSPMLCPFLQTTDSLDGREADKLTELGHNLQVTYGYVTAARAHGDGSSVESILKRALLRNNAGAIIVSTTRPERLPQYARIAGIAG